mmetsp:Transcript_5651/g.17028  ORF Transcript_5651/g.17028 Transcript_5651/m.17028 type:complete len:229 (-) Transcript_5651:907-1593(-)
MVARHNKGQVGAAGHSGHSGSSRCGHGIWYGVVCGHEVRSKRDRVTAAVLHEHGHAVARVHRHHMTGTVHGEGRDCRGRLCRTPAPGQPRCEVAHRHSPGRKTDGYVSGSSDRERCHATRKRPHFGRRFGRLLRGGTSLCSGGIHIRIHICICIGRPPSAHLVVPRPRRHNPRPCAGRASGTEPHQRVHRGGRVAGRGWNGRRRVNYLGNVCDTVRRQVWRRGTVGQP